MPRLLARCFLALLVLGWHPGPVRAGEPASAPAPPDLQELLSQLAKYGIIDQDVANAGPVVQCVLDGAAVEGCVKQLAGTKADALLKSDSKLVLAVDLVKAANDGDWVELLELSGTKVLKVVVCEVAMPIPDSVSGVICSGTFDKLVQMAETVVAAAVDAVADEAYWRLITLVGPKVACEVIPEDLEVSDIACGALGEIWTGIEQTAGAVVALVSDVGQTFSEGLQDAFDFMDDLLGTAPPQLSPAEYYMTFVASYYMNGVHAKLGLGPSKILSTPGQVHDKCMEYFDEDGICTLMRDRYTTEVAAYAEALTAWRETYFASQIRPALPYYYVKWVQTGKPSPIYGFYDVTSPCQKAVGALPWPSAQYPLPTTNGAQQMTPHVWACRGSAERAEQTLKTSEVFLAAQLAVLESKGCQIKNSAGQLQFPFQCTAVEAFQRCEVHFAGTELVRPSLARIGYGSTNARLCNFVISASQQPVPAAQATGQPPAYVDLLADPAVTVVVNRGPGVAVQWGQKVSLTAAQKLDPVPGGEAGVCRFGLDLTVRNGGTGTSPPFQNRLQVGVAPAASRAVGALAAGATVPQRLYFEVGTGTSVVSFSVDGGKQISEASEQNNEYRLTVEVTGACGVTLDDSVPTRAAARPEAVVTPHMLTVEAESLVQARKFVASSGRVTTGQATSYTRAAGAQGSQLVWSGAGPGATLELLVDVPIAATYVLELNVSSGPDYGDVEVSVDGEKGPLIRGYGPRATPSRPLQAGRFTFPAGEQKITFRVVEKNAASGGYSLGLDFIRLHPVGAAR